MSSNFDHAIKEVLRHEGGYVFDEKDPGGETNFGISKRAHPSVDIKRLTEDKAKEIYKEDYWDKANLSLIINEAVATRVFDFVVNMGIKSGIKQLQRALRSLGEPIVDDGVLGPVTSAAVNRQYWWMVVPTLQSEAAGYYRSLVAKNPDLEKFLNGWLRRAYGEF